VPQLEDNTEIIQNFSELNINKPFSYLEGEIYIREDKQGKVKKYFVAIMGNEIYIYKTKG
jgi:hypothetical protein